MASIAEVFMGSGTSKSGSPSVRLITSSPCERISRALLLITKVCEYPKRWMRSDNLFITFLVNEQRYYFGQIFGIPSQEKYFCNNILRCQQHLFYNIFLNYQIFKKNNLPD